MNGNIVSDMTTHWDSRVMELYHLQYKLHAINCGQIPCYKKMNTESKKIQQRIHTLKLSLEIDDLSCLKLHW